MVQPLGKTVQWFLTKLNVPLPHDPAMALLGISPGELKHIKTYSRTISSFIPNHPPQVGSDQDAL